MKHNNNTQLRINSSNLYIASLLDKFIDITTDLIITATECRVIGLRVAHNNDFPFIKQIGFPPDFNQKEGTIRDSRGDLECLCGRVVNNDYKGFEDLCSKNGTIWRNSSEEMKHISDEILNLREECLNLFNSHAVIPCKPNGHTEGILLIADKEPDLLNKRLICKLEKIGKNIAVFISNFEEVKSYIENLPAQKKDSKQIMIIEDDNDVKEILSECVNVLGYQPIAAINSKNAMDILEKTKIDAIIASYQIAGFNGIKFSREIYSRWQHYSPPVLLLSSRKNIDKKEDLSTAYISEYINKPLNMNEIFKSIHNVL